MIIEVNFGTVFTYLLCVQITLKMVKLAYHLLGKSF